MRIALRHERGFDRRPFAVRKRHRLPLCFHTETVTRATLPWNALFAVPVLHTRSIVRPLIRMRLRLARRWRRLMLDRGSTRSPQTLLRDDSAMGPELVLGFPSHGAPEGLSDGPEFWRAKYACELKLSSFSWPGEWFS